MISQKIGGAESFSYGPTQTSFLQLSRSVLSPCGGLAKFEAVRKTRELAKSEHSLELAQLASRGASAMHVETSTGDVKTHVQHVVHTVEVERPRIIKQTVQEPIIQKKILLQFINKVIDNPIVFQTVQKTVETPQLQIVKRTIEIPEIRMVRGIQTSESLGTARTSHFLLKRCVASAHNELSAFCSQVRRRSMPRRGWSSLPVPDGWFEVIWGPRPPSVQWPHQQKGKGKGVAPTAAPRGRWRNPDRGTRAPVQTRHDPPTRRSPEEVVSLPLRNEFRSWNELSKCWERILDPSSRCSRTL